MEAFAKIGIDGWGMLLYLVNFGVLFGVIGWLVVPKLTRLVDERRDQIANDLAASAKLKSEMEKAATEHEVEALRLKEEFAAEQAALVAEFKSKKEVLVADMQAEREKVLAEARSQIAEEKKRLMDEVKGDLVKVLQKSVKTFLGNADEKEVTASLDDAWKSLKDK